ncbi:MAG: hypothetical protein HFE63_01310 [Clostridiales bacterium]|nr:hypothetical protein [Clostridiales bacterium]
MKKRLTLTLLLCAAILASACASDTQSDETSSLPTDTTAPTDETNGLFVKDELPANLDLHNEKIRFSVISTRLNEFYIEEASGDIVNDAVYNAKKNVEERLNCEVEFVPFLYTSWNDRAAYKNLVGSSILSNSDDFDILSSTSYMSDFLLQGYFMDIADKPYIDLDKPWWWDGMWKNIEMNGIIPYITGDFSLGSIKSMMCMFYNKDIGADFGIENIHDIVFDGKWTLDKLEEMITLTYTDLNGNTKVDEEDRLGLVLEGSNYTTGFYEACGMKAFEKTSNGLEFVFDNAHCVEVIQRLCELIHNNDGAIIRGNDSSNFIADEALFNNGNVLITGGWFGCTESYRNLTFDYTILPYPKFDENQKDYMSTALTTYSSFGLPVTCQRIDSSCAVLEAFASEYYRNVIPAYFEIALKVKYTSDDETSAMFDLIRSSTNFSLDMILTNAFDYLADIQFKDAVNKNNSNWASKIASLKSSVLKRIDDVVAVYDNMRNN